MFPVRHASQPAPAVGNRSLLRGVPAYETRADFLRTSSRPPAAPRPVLCQSAPMHDAAYKGLFSHPPMVEDLLRGFAARGWSDKLDFETLEKLPADYVSDDLRQRHGDSVWRLRLQGRGKEWLYLLVMLEFQSTTDPFMAVRVLVYTGLLYQDLIRRGAFDEAGRLPPVLPVVLYNGPERWTAPVEAGDLIAPAGEALAPFQPSQRYFLLDEGRWGKDDLPGRNLMSALVGLETSGTAEALSEAVEALSGWLRDSGDDELRRAFAEWLRQVSSRRFGRARRSRRRRWKGEERCWRSGCRSGSKSGFDRDVSRDLNGGLSRAGNRASSADAPKNGRCCAGWRPGGSGPKRASGCRGCLHASRTRNGSPRSATRSSSADRGRSCSTARGRLARLS